MYCAPVTRLAVHSSFTFERKAALCSPGVLISATNSCSVLITAGVVSCSSAPSKLTRTQGTNSPAPVAFVVAMLCSSAMSGGLSVVFAQHRSSAPRSSSVSSRLYCTT